MAMAGKPTVIEKLLEDHRMVRTNLASLETADRSQWWEIFQQVTHDLVQHEIAEEEIVYPVVRKQLANGDQLADARIAEQSKAEELMDRMERKGREDKDFAANLTKLRSAVLEHAEEEERTVFAPLANAVDRDQLEKMAERYEKAKKMAPTHPHPTAPDTPPGNMVVGPVAAMADHFRDAMRKAS